MPFLLPSPRRHLGPLKGNVPRPWSLLLTQPVAGGIGIVALGGASRQRILQTIFRHKKGGPLPHPRPGRLYYGIIHDRGEEIDEAILEAGADFDCLHIHGGAATAGALRELLSRHGAKPLPPEKYWEKRFPHPQQILLREWHRLLLAAPTEEFLHLILAQPLAWKNLADRWPPPPEELREISRRVRLRTIMQHPPVIALAGLPNAGKSSLFNRLLEEERSLVFDRPGTTRDPVAAATSLRGYPVTLVDCAGMEPGSGTKLGRQSTAMARRQMREADLVLWIHDGSRRDRIAPPARLPVLEMVSHGDRLSPAWIKRLAEEPRLPAYSALTGKGEKTVEELLLKQLKLPPLPEEPLPLPFSRDLRKLLRSPGRRVPACLSVFLAGTKLR